MVRSMVSSRSNSASEETAKVDASFGEVVDGGHEMREGATEAVEAPHDEGVALVELGQGLVEARASGQGA